MLINRGIEKHEIFHYLNSSVCDILPFDLLSNLELGAKMLISHIAQNDIVFL